MYLGWIEDHYTQPIFHFKYWGFEFVEPMGVTAMYSIHFIMVIAAIGIIVLHGWAYRIAALILFILFTYTELIDLTYYLNHYYFVSLMAFLLIFVPAHRFYSLDCLLFGAGVDTNNSKGINDDAKSDAYGKHDTKRIRGFFGDFYTPLKNK